jgi:nicotinamidase-related amidase
MILDLVRAQLLVVDVQERLVPAMSDSERLIGSCRTLMQGARLLGAPIAISEQYPEGLGPTVADLSCAAVPRFAKKSFSCWRDPAIRSHLLESGRDQMILCGIEAHVCVLQTALDMREAGLEVFAVVDAIDSRKGTDKEATIRRMFATGVQVGTVEMVLFEWIGSAANASFPAVSSLIKAR